MRCATLLLTLTVLVMGVGEADASNRWVRRPFPGDPDEYQAKQTNGSCGVGILGCSDLTVSSREIQVPILTGDSTKQDWNTSETGKSRTKLPRNDAKRIRLFIQFAGSVFFLEK